MNTNSTPVKQISRRFLVSGKVQGVWFRASTREQATRLELKGYAKNLENGDVEVLAQGYPDAINELFAWLNEGPRLARVDRIKEVDAQDAIIVSDFRVL